MRILLDAIKLKYLSNLDGSSTNSTQAKHRIAQVKYGRVTFWTVYHK